MKLVLSSFSLFVMACSSLSSFTLPGAACAQASVVETGPVVYINPQQAASFQDSLRALAHEAGVAFVAEGQPLRPTLPPGYAPVVSPGGEPLPDVVARVASAYDYDVQREDSVFVLRKRYSDPDDLPDVTLGECAQALTDVCQITDALNPHLDFAQLGHSSAIHDFLTSLTPEQLQQMQDKARADTHVRAMPAPGADTEAFIRHRLEAAAQSQGLPVSELTPKQRDAVRQIIMVVRVQLPTISLKPDTLRQAAAKDPAFRWGGGPFRSFGYEIPLGASDAKTFMALVTPGDTRLYTAAGVPVLFTDKTVPLIRNHPTRTWSEGTSLASAISSVSARLGIGSGASVDSELAPKRVCVIGGATVPPAALLQALADVYGLRVLRHDDGRLQVTRRRRLVPLDYDAMLADIRSALPDPLSRAVAQNGVALTGRVRRQDIGVCATRALRTAAEPRIVASPEGHVALSSLSERENAALAVILTARQVESLVGLTAQGVPEIMTRFDELCLIGGPTRESGGRKFDMQFALPSADGGSPPHRLMSVGNLDYDPQNTGGSN